MGDKDILGLILAKRKPKLGLEEERSEEKKGEGEEEDPLVIGAEELIEAMKSGDAKATAEAFRSMSRMCRHSYEEED